MSNYATLKTAIQSAVYTNGNGEITGAGLQSVLLQIVNTVGDGYVFKGVATPGTSPGTPDENVFYIGGTGTYTNFGTSYTVPVGSVAVFMYDGSWTKSSVDVFSGIDNAPTAGSSLPVKSGGIYDAIRSSDMFINKGFYIDEGHLVSENAGTKYYTTSSSWDCLIVFCNGSDKIKINGLLSGANFRFFDSADIFNEQNIYSNFISMNTDGIVPDNAVVCLVNLQKSLYPDGYAEFSLERQIDYMKDIRSSDMLLNKGFYIDEGHLVSENVGTKNYTTSSSWDCAIIFCEGASRLTLKGVAVGANYRFYDSADIFTGDNIYSNFIGMNTEGVVPDNAVVCILNLQKSLYVGGYADFSLEREYKKEINLLLIGNSAGQDAISYVPFILGNIGVKSVRIGLLMESDSTISMHVDNFNNETAAYTLYFFDSSDGNSWVNRGSKTIQWALDNYKWDIIAFHQGANSDTATYVGDIQPYLNQIANLISAYVDYGVKFAFYQNQSRPATTIHGANWSDGNITQHYLNTVDFCEKIAGETIFENIIPVGTAIQNARTIASIKALGDYASEASNTSGLGYLTYDGIHLQEGLPCQIAAYTWVLSLLDIYGLKEHSINGESTRVDSSWTTGKGIPGPHGSPVGSTDANCMIAQKCAIMAIKNPYEVTDMSYIVNPS